MFGSAPDCRAPLPSPAGAPIFRRCRSPPDLSTSSGAGFRSAASSGARSPGTRTSPSRPRATSGRPAPSTRKRPRPSTSMTRRATTTASAATPRATRSASCARPRGIGFMEAVERPGRRGRHGDAGPRPGGRRARRRERQGLAEAMEAAVRFYRTQLAGARAAEARAYLDRRGLAEATRDRFEIGFAPDSRTALLEHLTAKGFPRERLAEAGLIVRAARRRQRPTTASAAGSCFRSATSAGRAHRLRRPRHRRRASSRST